MRVFFLLLAVFATTTTLHAQNTPELTPSGEEAPIRAVRLVEAGGVEARIERVFFGQVAARETLDLSFVVGGRLVMFDAQEGEFLDEGVLIAALDLAPFERAVERAELELAQADRTLERTRALAQSNAATATAAEDAQTARDLAAVSLSAANDDLEDAQLTAPFRALVASRLAPNFANVSPGEPIVRLHDMSEVRVEIDVPERLFQRLSDVDGLSFIGTSPLFDGEVPLELREFNAETQNIGQSYRVTLALPPTEVPAAIIPGASMTVVARVQATNMDAMPLPLSAVILSGDSAQVMAYEPRPDGETGTLRLVDVVVSSRTGTRIMATGIAPDQRIVAAGLQMLREGDIVRPFTGLSVE